MRLPLAAASLLLLSSPSFAGSIGAAGPVAHVTGGDITGTFIPGGAGSAVFRGVPTAQPPVGPLRWREPMPIVPWTGARPALRPGAPAVQVDMGWNKADAQEASEDCLYVDVWTPTMSRSARLPVMVWLHGGGNVGGAGGADPVYDGRAFISRGVVLVVVEYRLGVLGFLSHPELTAESPHHSSGNYGFLDQIAALRWVRDNARQFGGDPGNVTLFGQSAGGTDVFALMASPLAAGLFQRAISESGILIPQLTKTLAENEAAGLAAAGAVTAPQEPTLAALRALPAARILRITAGSPITVDGWVFPKAPLSVWKDHGEAQVPFIVGTNAVEFAAGSREAAMQQLKGFYGPRSDEIAGLYGLAGPARPADPLYGDGLDQLGSDAFRLPSILLGAWHAEGGAPTWQYELDRAIPPNPSVGHSGDLPYVFGNFHVPGNLTGDYGPADRALSATIQGYWTALASSGNPNKAGLPAWPAYDSRGRAYMAFTKDAGTEVRTAEREGFIGAFRQALTRSLDSPAAAAPTAPDAVRNAEKASSAR